MCVCVCVCVCVYVCVYSHLLLQERGDTYIHARAHIVVSNLYMYTQQCGIAETKTISFVTADVKEEEKRTGGSAKNCRQWRRRTERDPLKAEKDLRMVWDAPPAGAQGARVGSQGGVTQEAGDSPGVGDTKAKNKEARACAILAKLITSPHLSTGDFARCALVKDILATLQTLVCV